MAAVAPDDRRRRCLDLRRERLESKRRRIESLKHELDQMSGTDPLPLPALPALEESPSSIVVSLPISARKSARKMAKDPVAAAKVLQILCHGNFMGVWEGLVFQGMIDSCREIFG